MICKLVRIVVKTGPESFHSFRQLHRRSSAWCFMTKPYYDTACGLEDGAHLADLIIAVVRTFSDCLCVGQTLVKNPYQ